MANALTFFDSTSDEPVATPSATPSGALSLTRRLPLPATPADVARVVDEHTVALRERAVTFFQESQFREITYTTRDTLSNVASIIVCIHAFELYYLRKEILADRYAFTIPAIPFLGIPDQAVEVPDMFLLLSKSFWSPAWLWFLTSTFIPLFFAFYFNLSAARSAGAGGRKRGSYQFSVDPLIFSIAKGVVTYVVYQQGATFGGWIDPVSVARINSAMYGGWKGVLTGTFIMGVASFYDAVLRK